MFFFRPPQRHDTLYVHRWGYDVYMALRQNHWGIYRCCNRIWVRRSLSSYGAT